MTESAKALVEAANTRINQQDRRSGLFLESRKSQSNRLLYRLLLLTALLLVFFAVRALRYPTTEMDQDEVWTIWQTFGTPQQIIQWTPFDWGPLFYLILGLWKGLTGIHPDVVRLSTTLLFLPGCAALYRVTRRLWDEKTAWLALVAYGTVGYSIYLTTLLHGYAMVVALMPFALWGTIRYFDHPTVKRGLLLAVVTIAMIYTHPTSVIAIALLGLFTIPMYGWRIWRWWLPGLVAFVCGLPELFSKINVLLTRTNAYTNAVKQSTLTIPSIQTTIQSLFHAYTSMGDIMWIPVSFLAFVGLLFGLYRQQYRRQTAALGLWLLAIIPIHFADQVIGAYDPPKHLWWLTTAMALCVAVGLSRLPRVILVIGSLAAIGIAFSPLPVFFYNPDRFPFIANFSYLAQHYQGGDALLINPQCNKAPPELWDYFTQAYFPQGLHVINSPQGYRRIWYANQQCSDNDVILKQLTDQYIAGSFVGPWKFTFQFYEAPPDTSGILFENGFRFHGVDIENSALDLLSVRLPGETVALRLWWSVDQPNLQGYSVGVGLLSSSGKLITQFDQEPISSETVLTPSRWTPGQVYSETRNLTLPNPLPSGSYQLYLTVYRPDQNLRIDAPGLNSDKLLPIGKIQIKAFPAP